MPFRQGGKNDGNDALAIAVAARQPTMRCVPTKTVEQQAILSWHRARSGFNDERTALINRLRRLLAEFGIVIAQSSDQLLKALPGLSTDDRIPTPLRAMLLEAREQFAALQARIERCDVEIGAHARDNESARRAREVLGVGPLTASAFAATVPDPRLFRHGHQLGDRVAKESIGIGGKGLPSNPTINTLYNTLLHAVGDQRPHFNLIGEDRENPTLAGPLAELLIA